MSILAYTGLMGSGKSYVVTEHQILPALRMGRRVVTNIPLNEDAVRRDFPYGEVVNLPLQKIQAEPAEIYEYCTPGSILILDEVWRLFPSGQKSNQVPEPFRKLLAEHRHMVNAEGQSCQIVLVTQDLAQIAAFARILVEQTFRTTKLSAVGMRGGYRLDVFNGPVSGPNPNLQNRMREIYGRYTKAVWQYYQSHTMAEKANQSGADERAIDKRGNILRSPALIIGAVVAVAIGVWAFPTALHSFSRKDSAIMHSQAASAKKGAASAGARPEAAAPQPARALFTATTGTQSSRSAGWRVAGVVINHAEASLSRALLTDGTRTIVLAFASACKSLDVGTTVCELDGEEYSERGWIAPTARVFNAPAAPGP